MPHPDPTEDSVDFIVSGGRSVGARVVMVEGSQGGTGGNGFSLEGVLVLVDHEDVIVFSLGFDCLILVELDFFFFFSKFPF